MSKRILAFICMLALLVGLLPVGALAETQSTPDTYMVGYAKTNINPPQYEGSILPIYLTGNGNDSERACTGMMDDNGDGETNENDGLFTTCTAVTDAKGTTVLYITLDTLQGETDAVSAIRNKISKELVVGEGEPPITGSQIIISGSHTHSAPNLLSLKNSDRKDSEGNPDTALNEAIKGYYDEILDKILTTAQAAYDDREAATMKRGSIDATTATAAMGYNSGNGYQMNFLRHYQITAEYKEWSWSSFSYVTKDQKSYVVGGTLFGTGSQTVGGNAAFSGYEVTAADHVAEADNTMHLLQFEFAEGSEKEPIVMVNWRAHPTTNSGDVTKTLVSSDYVNALRYQLELKGYRGAFFQGAGANTRISSDYHTDWTAECPTSGTAETNTYGKLLAEIADYCLQNNMTSNLSCGDIRIIQRTFTGELQQDSEGLQAVVATITNEDGTIKTDISFPYTGTYNNEEYTVNSTFHAQQINQRKKKAAAGDTDFTTQEIAVVSLGNAAAFVTAPNELSDRYGISSYSDTENELWATLNNDDTYGTPFVVTHANGMKGYLPNSLNYNYNSNVVDYNGNALPLGAGSYEANTSHYEAGTGEELITAFGEMLAELDQEEETKYCEACKEDVVWKPVSYLQYTDDYLGSGHYYLTEDIPSNARKTVRAGETLCLDLNGKNLTTNGRSFKVETGAALNVFDNAETGSITSTYNSNSPQNGTLLIQGNVNIYGGTLKFDNSVSGDSGVNRGGVVGIESGGKLSMYGGTIQGNDKMVTGNVNDAGAGAAIYMVNGEVYLYNDAKVLSGTVAEGSFGPCIALGKNVNNKIYLYDNAYVDDIYFRSENSTNLTVSGTFTGNVGLSYASDFTLSTRMTIGNVADNADISGATFRLPETVKDWQVYTDGTDLKIKGYLATTVAVIGENEYPTLQAAVNGYTENSIIKLIKAVSGESTTTVAKNVYLDLNGFDITCPVNVTGGTLYCMDSQTDDYDIGTNNDEYGKFTNISGNVEGIPEESELAEDGYLKVVESNEVSFHRVNLQLTAISLRAEYKGECAPSVYYKSNFKGDQKVAAAVKQYGIALSVQEMPDDNNLDSKCEYSKFDTFADGSTGNAANGTLLYGIMKPTNPTMINYRNANMAIYGRAYIQTETGYMFGHGYNPNLKQVTEAADAMLSDPSVTDSVKENIKKNLVLMYNAYTSVMKSWDLTNLKDIAKNDGALKVLVVGNSHGLDATNLLYEVFKDQEYSEQKVVLGALYKSGCTMKEHSDFMTNGLPNYDYYENDGSNADGSWTVIEDTVADTALYAHQWDIVIMQQMSNYAATASTFSKTQFKTVINYVKDHQVGTPRFGWHMVWTHPDGNEYLYSNGSNSNLLNPDPESWLNYHVKNFPSATDPTKYDQSVMYDKMVACAQEYIENDTTFLGSDVYDFVIPSATAVQYAHDVQGMAEAEVYRDYTHLSDYSRLMVAYLWYAKITGNTVSNVGISAIPSVLHHNNSTYPVVSTGLKITSDMQANILEAVNHALQYPYQLTK